jgi:hypothetical protein
VTGANKGIIGNVKAGNLVVGDNAKIEVTTVAPPLMERMQALQRAVEAYDGPADTRIDLLTAHRELVGELGAPKPDKNKVIAKLNQITSLAGSATTIATAVTALANAIPLVL